MATKKPTKPTEPKNTGFRGFINVNLTEEDKAKIKNTPNDAYMLLATLEQNIKGGFKFTFSWDSYSQCHQVIGTRSDKDHPDYGILMSGRGSTPLKAYKQWLYMLTAYVGEENWEDSLTGNSRYVVDD